MDRSQWTRRIARLDAHEFPWGRNALRRLNQMHGSYDIAQDDLRYVLTTFVVVPMRRLDRWGWRRLTEHERVAGANYYRATHVERALASGGLKARGAIARRLPPRPRPKYFRQMSSMRSCPSGHAVGELGTFLSTTTPTAGT